MDRDLIRRIHSDVKSMNGDFNFADALIKNTIHTTQNEIYCFIMCWKSIPEKYLYDTYKEIFFMVEGGYMYTDFFNEELVAKIKSLNHKDTINNPELVNQVDNKGYITIFHGHCKATLKNSNSWTTSKHVATYFAQRNALFHDSKDCYVVSGKVKLSDVIAYITERNEFEIVVQPKYIKQRSKEIFPKLPEMGGLSIFKEPTL